MMQCPPAEVKPPAEAFRPYIKPMTLGDVALRFFYATQEAKDWYDPVKPHAALEFDWVSQHVPLAGERILDAGAHHGQYALFLAAKAGSVGGEVITVDAVESNCSITEANLALNGLTAQVVHGAVTCRRGPVQFTGETNGRVVERGVTSVTGYRLIDLMPDTTVVKLDVEGEEFRILPEAVPAMPSVHTWIVEVHPWKTRDPHTLMPVFDSAWDVWRVEKASMRVEPYAAGARWDTHATVIARRR